QLAQNVRALVVTLGAKGSMIYCDGKVLEIPCVEAEQVIDPTGCGDAYRAGLLYGIVNGMDWETTGRLAALMGALKIASRGGQNHVHSRDEIVNRYRELFGTNLA
ncbi:MAG: PfkB family carbohydrate kinase, partial [Sulfurimicrobium sp.]|nr:PfkB family carbohydrate kinase [Sulfurimicrobium sp.]